MLSGVLAQQLEQLRTSPQNLLKVLKSLQLDSYDPRIVEINQNTSFLVLDNPKSNRRQERRQSYLLNRDDGKNWTFANRLEADDVMKSLWITEYFPSDFNQSSQCSLFGKEVPPSINGKEWDMKSAVAIRDKDSIKIHLFPFPHTKADLEYWKFRGMLVDAGVFESSSLSKSHPECRINFGLDKDGRIEYLNVGFNDPELQYSNGFQGPGWASLPRVGAQTGPQNGLPPEFTHLKITKDRIKLESAGAVPAGASGIRWKVKLDIPIWEKGL